MVRQRAPRSKLFPACTQILRSREKRETERPGFSGFWSVPTPTATPLATCPQICCRCTLHRVACGRHSAHSRPRCATVPVPPAPPHTPPGSGQVSLSRSLCSASQLAHCLSPSCLSPLVVFHYHCVVRIPLIGALHAHVTCTCACACACACARTRACRRGVVGSVFHNMNYSDANGAAPNTHYLYSSRTSSAPGIRATEGEGRMGRRENKSALGSQ